MEASEIEMLIIKDFHPVNNSQILPKESGALDPNQNELHLLDEQQTLEEINARFTQHHLVRRILVSYNYPIPKQNGLWILVFAISFFALCLGCCWVTNLWYWPYNIHCK